MRFLALGIVVVFPLLDLYLTMRFADRSGVPLWAWLLVGTLAGVWIVRNERRAFRTRTLASMHGHFSLLRTVLDSGRRVLAGILLLVPGVISDAVALVLLALPINLGARFGPQAATAGTSRSQRREALDGEFRRLD